MQARLASLSVLWTALTCAAVVAGLEGYNALSREPSLLASRAAAYASAAPGAPAVLLVGTCTVDNVFKLQTVAAELGPGHRVFNLSAKGTGPLDWYLMLSSALPRATPGDTLVLPYALDDLSAAVYPWESRVMDLASWRDMPRVLDMTCTSYKCRADMMLRKLSLTYRYRGLESRRIWSALSVDQAVQVPMLPGGIFHPERFAGERSCRLPDEKTLKVQRPAPGGPTRMQIRLGDWERGPANHQHVRAVDNQRQIATAYWGYPPRKGTPQPRNARARRYLWATLALARERGYRLLFVKLRGGIRDMEPNAPAEIKGKRGHVVILPAEPSLMAAHVRGKQRLADEVRQRLSRRLARQVRQFTAGDQ